MAYSELDRFYDALKGHPKDHVPIYPLIGGWAVSNFSSYPTSQVAANPRLFAEAEINAKETMGYDPVYAYMDAVYIAEAFGCNVRFLDTGTVVEPLELEIQGVDDLAKLRVPNVESEARLPMVIESVRLLSKYVSGKVPVLPLFEGPFTTACRVVGSEQVMRMTYRLRPALEKLLDIMADFLIRFGQVLVKNGAHMIIIPEPTGSSSMISPRMFKELVVPRLKRFTNELGVPWILHMCGDTTSILPLMVETGATVLSLDQCMDLSNCRKVVPEAVIGGNVDPINVLLMGTPEQVAEDTLRSIKQAGRPFVLMSGCGVPPGVPKENVEAMIKTAKDYGTGKV